MLLVHVGDVDRGEVFTHGWGNFLQATKRKMGLRPPFRWLQTAAYSCAKVHWQFGEGPRYCDSPDQVGYDAVISWAFERAVAVGLVPECVAKAKGSCFCLGGLGGGTVFVAILAARTRARAFARVRARPRCPRCAVPLGLACRTASPPIPMAQRHPDHALPTNHHGTAIHTPCTALCCWDWRGGRGVGSAVPLGVHSVAEPA